MSTARPQMVGRLSLACLLGTWVITGCSGASDSGASSYTPKPIVTSTVTASPDSTWSLASAQAACAAELGQWSWGESRFTLDPPTFRGGLGIQAQLNTVTFTECMLQQIRAPGAPSRSDLDADGKWRFKHADVPLLVTSQWRENSGTITIAVDGASNT